MLNLTASRINRSDEVDFDPASVLTAVGCALVIGATGTVKPSGGNAGEVFVGASLSQPLTLTNYPRIEVLVSGTNNKITLTRTPIAGTLRVADLATNTSLAAGAPATVPGEYSISGLDITLHSSRQGLNTVVYYQYVPSTIEARTLQGDIQPGGAASLTTGKVGVCRAGKIVTTEYDPTVDWTAAAPAVKTGANGRFTIGGNGGVVPNAQVVQAPTSSDGLLHLYFSA